MPSGAALAEREPRPEKEETRASRNRQALGEGVPSSLDSGRPGDAVDISRCRGFFPFPYPQPEGVPWTLPRCPGHGSRQTASVT
jgi:hypothetical protein